MESKLFKVGCDNCGAEYRINSRGEMNCPFCGSKIYLNDKDFEEYLKVRDEMLTKDCINNDLVNTDGDVLGIWHEESSKLFTSKHGRTITIKYFFSPEEDVYIGKEKIIYILDKNIFKPVKDLLFPSADIKNLQKYFPTIVNKVELDDGRVLIALDKPENVYPLFMFNNLDAKQVAWMISRMENLGCVFEFNEIGFEKVDINDFYINPKTHELYFLGKNWSTFAKIPTKKYLEDIRKVAAEVVNDSTVPELCREFLNTAPEADAYSDFHKWDNVIENGFNGHNFHKFV